MSNIFTGIRNWDMWVSGAGTLGAADFGLLNFSNGSVDFNVHPNFSSGVNGVRTG